MTRGKATRGQTGQIAAAMGSAILAICLASGTAVARQQEQPKQDQTKQDIPDAPSASRPFPGVPPPSSSNPAPPPASQAPPPNQPPPKESVEEPVYAPGVAPAPPFNVTTVPQGGATAERSRRQRRAVQDHREHQPGRGSGHGERRFRTSGKRPAVPGFQWFSRTARNRF